MRLAARLRLRGGVYYFRLVFPRVLRPLFQGKRELVVSLKTRDPRTAQLLAYAHSARALGIFQALKVSMSQGDDKKIPLPWEKLVSRYEEEVDFGSKKVKITVDPTKPGDHEQGQDALQRTLRQLGPSWAGAKVLGTETPKPSQPEKKRGTRIIDDAIIKDWQDDIAKLAPKTRYQYLNDLKSFASLIQAAHRDKKEPLLISDYSTAEVNSYVQHLRRREGGAKPKTINRHLTAITSFFTYARKAGQWFEPSYPTDGHWIEITDEEQAEDSWRPFDDTDLNAIFDPANYAVHTKPHEFWMPLLGLYTGGRINELSQLLLSDVKATDGWVIEFSENKRAEPNPVAVDQGYKKLKQAASRRTIPLHPVLIELGFLKYIDDVHAVAAEQALSGPIRLFPYLMWDAFGRFADVPSEAFSRYLRRVITDEAQRESKVFHSFRSTINVLLKNCKEVHREWRECFLGQKRDSVNEIFYSGGKPATPFEIVKQEVVPRLQFPAANVQALHYPREAMRAALIAETKRTVSLRAHRAAEAAKKAERGDGSA